MSKILKYTIGMLASVLLIYLSLDIQDLEKQRKISKPDEFNAIDYATKFWNDSLPLCIEGATEIDSLLELLSENQESAFNNYGRKLGISKTHYFLVKGNGIIEKVDSEYIVLSLDNQKNIKVAIDFIFGNAVRDGSGKVNINDFLNMTDFNDVSVAINKLVKEKIVSSLRNSATVGNTLKFAGAFEISEENMNLADILIIPVSIKLSNGKSE